MSKCILAFLGWRIDTFPKGVSCVIIVAPHTSNWDFFFGILYKFAENIDTLFLAKEELFRGPAGIFLSLLKGIPVNRSQPHRMVEDLAIKFEENNDLRIVITPEGTRDQVKQWKTGFFYIAKEAEKPILPIALDYKNKWIKVGPFLKPKSVRRTMNWVYEFYAHVRGHKKKDVPHRYKEIKEAADKSSSDSKNQSTEKPTAPDKNI